MNKVFLDVRSRDEFLKDGIIDSINIPHTELINSLDTIPQDRDVLVYCKTGKASWLATKVLERLGYNAIDIQSISVARRLLNETQDF